MSPKHSRFGFVVALSLAAGGLVMAQPGPNAGRGPVQDDQPVKLTGPAAKKADDLIRGYTARIEKEIEQARKEVDRLRAELHELIDVRYEMAAAIADLRGELAAKGTYSADLIGQGQVGAQDRTAAPPQAQRQAMAFRRDLLYGLGSALPKNPTPEQRDQIRRLAPRADLKRLIERLRSDVEQTRIEVDQMAYHLLELRAGISASYQGFGGMGGGMGGGIRVPWFGSMGVQGGMM
ncbi:MAG: hypothetical protein ACHRXM_27085 [Isosphaerales bacterium]